MTIMKLYSEKSSKASIKSMHYKFWDSAFLVLNIFLSNLHSPFEEVNVDSTNSFSQIFGDMFEHLAKEYFSIKKFWVKFYKFTRVLFQ